MEEKSIWMFLFFGLLILCVIITIFLIKSAGGLDSKKEYEQLKVKYADLATIHTKTLRTAMEMKADDTSTNTNGTKKPEAAELTKQNEQLQKRIKEQGEKITGWRSVLLGGDKTDAEIMEEIVRLKNEAAQYSKERQ